MIVRAAIIAAILLVIAPGASGGELFDDEAIAFARKLDQYGLSLWPVQYRGRGAILDTLARDRLRQMLGAPAIDGTSPAFGYIELYFNTGRYLDRPVIYIREKTMRSFLVERSTGRWREQFERTWRLPPAALLDAEAGEFLVRAGRAKRSDWKPC